MKLVIDFPGLPRVHVGNVAEALYLAGYDATIVGQVTERREEAYDLFGNDMSYLVDEIVPLEAE